MLVGALDRLDHPIALTWRISLRGAAIAALVSAALSFVSPVSLAGPPPEGFADLVDQVKPAVVYIASTETIARSAPGGRQFEIPPELRGTPFEQFLRRFFGQEPGREDDGVGPGAESAMALGSGFIVDPSGYVVTNNHVIHNARKVQVTLADGRKYAARIVGKDQRTDLALLKVESNTALPFVSWGDSDKVRAGDWVIAIGNPFGLGGTVTAGIVSARGRDIQSGPFDDYLQIDAPINQGNSGGPSFDRNGTVIGINAAIFSPSGGSVGIGFAIPSSVAQPIIAELRTRGRIERGWLGVSVQPVTREIADALGLQSEQGALVAEVTPNSPAAKAKLQQGDVIRSIDGQPIGQARELARLVAAAGPHKTLTLAVWRDRKEISVAVPLDRLLDGQNEATTEGPAKPNTPPAEATATLGLSLAPLTSEARRQLQISEKAAGVLIINVDGDSAAGEAGLAPGDVIVKVDDKRVTAPQDVVNGVRAASQAKRKVVLLLVERRGSARFVGLPLS